MINLPKTLGYTAIQISAAALTWMWCAIVRYRFNTEHPTGVGSAMANFFWEFAWLGVVLAALLGGALILSDLKKWQRFYDWVFYFGIWLMVVWVGSAVCAMETPFVGRLSLDGRHF